MNRLTYLSLGLTALLLLTACGTLENAFNSDQQPYNHVADVEAWRASRLGSLTSEGGWLSLVGLDWLKPGKNTLGSDRSNDIVLNQGPARWGTIELTDEVITFTGIHPEVMINGTDSSEAVLIADTQGEPTVVSFGSLSFYPIQRGSFALRIKDSQARTRVEFAGLDYFPIDEGWRIKADFEPAVGGESIEIGNVLGQINPEAKYGTATFKLQGRTYRLDAIGDADAESLFIIFADKTSGRETYGAGRFLYTDLPQDGELIIDFNRAYNPPCAFTEYSTCPLPPAQNRLPLAVTAGEKKYSTNKG